MKFSKRFAWVALAMSCVPLAACSAGDKKASPVEAALGKSAAAPEETVVNETVPTTAPVVETSPPTTAAPAVMPRLVGLTEAVARQQLQSAGVAPDLIVVKTRESIGNAGFVLEQNPSESALARGAVTLFVSAPLAPMESFVEKPVGELRTYLEERGVKLRVESILDDAKPDGTISEHSPAAGEQLGPEVLAKVTSKPVTFNLVDTKPVQKDGQFSPDQTGEFFTNGSRAPRSLLLGSYYDDRSPWIEYDLSRDWRFLRGTVGVSDDAKSDTKIRLDILGDGNPLYSKEFVLGESVPIDIDVSDRLRLRIQITGTSGQGLVLGDLRLVGSPDKVPALTTPPS
jgi:NPCBM/NEW2 domain/PASTA domain